MSLGQQELVDVCVGGWGGGSIVSSCWRKLMQLRAVMLLEFELSPARHGFVSGLSPCVVPCSGKQVGHRLTAQ